MAVAPFPRRASFRGAADGNRYLGIGARGKGGEGQNEDVSVIFQMQGRGTKRIGFLDRTAYACGSQAHKARIRLARSAMWFIDNTKQTGVLVIEQVRFDRETEEAGRG